MKKKKQEGVRYNTVPKGKLLVGTLWADAILMAITGICVLLGHESVGIAILVIAVGFVVSNVVLYLKQFSNVLIFTDQKIIRKKQSISWDEVYITTYCFAFMRADNYVSYCFFSDHYLSIEEVYSWKEKRKGFYILLNYKRAEFILSKYNKRVRMLDLARADRDGVMGMIATHNAVLAKKEELENKE